MSSSDIEDVLSSIRRLVTGDLRPRATAAAAAHDAAADEAPVAVAPAADGRLLLTPALRVVPPAPAAPPVAAAPRPPIDGVLSLIGARVAAPPAGFEAETGDAFDAATEAGPPRPVAAVTLVVPAAEARPAAAEAPDLSGRAGGVPPDEPVAQAAPAVGGEDDDDADLRAPVVDLDEDILRELIRDVLREELQGPMGERITRNVRKLVRAELARAVTLRHVD